MQFIVKDHTLTYKIIGGIFDFYLFIGNKDPKFAVSNYHNFIQKNGPTIPPFWALGFH